MVNQRSKVVQSRKGLQKEKEGVPAQQLASGIHCIGESAIYSRTCKLYILLGSIVSPADWVIPELNGMPVFIQTASEQAAHSSTENQKPVGLISHTNNRHHVTDRDVIICLKKLPREGQAGLYIYDVDRRNSTPDRS